MAVRKLAGLRPSGRLLVVSLIIVSLIFAACVLTLGLFAQGVNGYEVSLSQVLFPTATFILTSGFVVLLSWIIYGVLRHRSLAASFIPVTIGLTILYDTILLIPSVRYGVPFDRWDVWFYLGFAHDLSRTGAVNLLTDFYPGFQVLTVTLDNLSGVDPTTSVGIFFSILAASRIPVVALTARRLVGPNGGLLAAAVAAIAGFTTTGLYGSPWAFSLLLLDFYVMASVMTPAKSSGAMRILQLVLGTGIVIAHILTAVALVLALCLLFVLVILARTTDPSRQLLKKAPAIGSLVVLTVGYLFLLTNVYQVTIETIISNLGRSNPISLEAALSRNFTLTAIGQVLFPEMVTGALAFGGLVFTWRHKQLWNRGVFVAVLFSSSVFLFLLEETLVRKSLFGPNRPLSLAVQTTPILAAMLLVGERTVSPLKSPASPRHPRLWSTRRSPFLVATSLFLVAAFAFGSTTVYPGPDVFNVSPQLSHCEQSAVVWVGTSGTPQPIITDESLSRSSYYYSRALSNWTSGYWGYQNALPSHLSLQDLHGPATILISNHILAKGATGLVPNWTISNADWISFALTPGLDSVYDCGSAKAFVLNPI